MTVPDPERPGRPSGAPPNGTARAVRSDHHPINWLLLLPLVVTLFPPIYNKLDPTAFNMPFFYWYQLVAIPFSVVVTLIVYRKTRV